MSSAPSISRAAAPELTGEAGEAWPLSVVSIEATGIDCIEIAGGGEEGGDSGAGEEFHGAC